MLGRLYVSLFVLTLIFATSMSFATLGVYVDEYWPAGVAGGVLIVFLAIARATIPGPLRALSGGQRKVARTAVAMFGSWWGLELFTMALLTWILGKRLLDITVGSSSAYLTLGLVIFLGFVGIGIGGALAMTAYFLYVRNDSIVVPSRLEKHLHAEQHHGALAGHS